MRLEPGRLLVEGVISDQRTNTLEPSCRDITRDFGEPCCSQYLRKAIIRFALFRSAQSIDQTFQDGVGFLGVYREPPTGLVRPRSVPEDIEGSALNV